MRVNAFKICGKCWVNNLTTNDRGDSFSRMGSQQQSLLLHELVRRLLQRGTPAQMALFFHKYHEADIADALEVLTPEERVSFFRKLDSELAADVLEEMSPQYRLQLITTLKSSRIAGYVEEMHPDDAADLLDELFAADGEKAKEVFDALSKSGAKEMRELLSYNPDSAGALMTKEFISIPQNLTISQARELVISLNPPDSEVSFYVYVVDDASRLVGFTSLRNLLVIDGDQMVKDVRRDNPISVHMDDDQEDVALVIQKYNLITVPVIDDENRLIGIVSFDDVVDVVVEEATEDLYKLSGTGEIDESRLLFGRPFQAIQSRLPWLFMTMGGGIVASLVMRLFSTHYPGGVIPLALALSFIPLLMGLGGNIGNQSATIIVRGIATGMLKDRSILHFIGREVFIGLSLGGVISLVIWLTLVILGYSSQFALIVSASVSINAAIAAFIGSALPFLFRMLKIDPAVASAPFISTALDIIGQLVYFAMTLLFILVILPWLF